MREMVEMLVKKGIATGDYNFIREAANLCSDESGVFMAVDDEYVMIDDDMFYFNGAFD